jgi:protein SCO1/2
MATLVLVVALLLIAACGSDSSTSATGSTGAGGLVGIQRDQPLDVSQVTLPEVRVGSPDRPFTMAAEPGELLFVYFGYTHCPDLCPTTLADLRNALAQIGPEQSARVELAFVTVDPDRDTPEILGPFLASFVTGAHALRTEDTAALAAAEDAFLASSTVSTDVDGTVEVSHTAISYLVDSQGRVVDEIPFGTTADGMANDIGLLLTTQGTTAP